MTIWIEKIYPSLFDISYNYGTDFDQWDASKWKENWYVFDTSGLFTYFSVIA